MAGGIGDAKSLIQQVKKRGRVIAFDHPTAERICARMREGESVVSITRGRGMPSWAVMRGWMSKEIGRAHV